MSYREMDDSKRGKGVTMLFAVRSESCDRTLRTYRRRSLKRIGISALVVFQEPM